MLLLLYYVLLQRLAVFFLEHLSLAVFLDASGDVVLYLFVLGSIEGDEILTRNFSLILLLLVVLREEESGGCESLISEWGVPF